MASIDSAVLIEELIANNGYYASDPRIVKIVEYTTVEGNVCWGVVYPQDPEDRYKASFYVRAPRTIWTRDGGDLRTKRSTVNVKYLPREYQHIQSWGKYLGSVQHYIDEQQELASTEGAPVDALYFSNTEKQWRCASELGPNHTFIKFHTQRMKSIN